MKNKLLLGLGAVSALGTLPMVAAACSNDKGGVIDGVTVKHLNFTHPKRPTVPVTKITLNKEFGITEGQKMKSIVMINDGGDINDKSFNQSAWEGLLTFADKQNGVSSNEYTVLEVKEGKYEQAYREALDSKYQVWLLPGFLHQQNVSAFLQKPENAKKFKELGIVLIGADYTSLDNVKDLEGHAIFQDFKTKEAAFVAGYAAAKFLSTEKEYKDRSFATLGGGAFPGVTDFNEGFMKGILYWNQQQNGDSTKIHTTTKTVDLGSGFDQDQTNTASVDAMLSTDPKMVMAVAGQTTFQVTKHEKFNGKGKYIVGVDVDQALTASSEQQTYFTSIVKNIGQSTYDAVSALALGKNVEGLEIDKKDSIMSHGYDKGWVGVSKTHIEGDKQILAQQALDEAEKLFKSLDQDILEWLHSSKATKDGEEIENIQQRMDALNAALIIENK
ncbi:BMP family ABC transporter substrate-binding protein [Mycoplasma zalophidermidis]|uniref:BMP family ABC transporter substrate-binding protein n=1 Tax=Mycoplasma zalophidermidis TaxID=398174 RepID=A0ABS6DSC1_9MOLU|nr:BMP family ABC transporter substrate-binding protein [Mycoplasma zalophidermidis]MBU4690015.1 BMP family ABC transporter substrate-binding protein [Mycoplasma zalophidermidis]MBU4693831.1 BMP family ABC transporter substrate-binding protein [Mycoplasma zalophidermidis]